ncbi:HYC_CC_PP family protein [Pedobacter antarcticus]|jgi:hypothetical protein|nr:hypothetical protein [Pedobacter antarcticus]
MKKTLLIFLAVFYFGISQGATVYLHYCMGELVQMGMIESQSPSCDFCGMTSKQAKEKTCCEKETKLLKVDESQKTVPSHFQFEQAPAIVLKTITWQTKNVIIPIELGKASLSNAPPQKQDIPVFIRNCTYRI